MACCLQFFGTGRTIDPADNSRTFYRHIKKLPAAHWLKYDVSNAAITIQQYWDVSKRVVNVPLNEALDRLNALLTLSVNRRLRSDVPLGTSLSGGLDSAAIAAKLFELEVRGLKTFTASFPGFEKDESGKAKQLSDKLGFNNYIIASSADDLAEDFAQAGLLP